MQNAEIIHVYQPDSATNMDLIKNNKRGWQYQGWAKFNCLSVCLLLAGYSGLRER
jgi:hypothetical protein